LESEILAQTKSTFLVDFIVYKGSRFL